MKHLLFFILAIGSLFTLVNTAVGGPFALSDVVTNNHKGYFVAIGDLNGDGKPDLVSVDEVSTFTIATNAGGGIFVSNATYNVGANTYPFAAAIADINGDGKPDIITANGGPNTVTIFTNAGGGIFVSNATYAVGIQPYFVLVTDINGDGKPDIITANYIDGTLTILTNAGGTFPVAHTVQVVNSLSSPQQFAVADINGDGKPDLIAGDPQDSLIEVLTNAGGGIFVSSAVYAAGVQSVVAADFNNDGKMDVACDDGGNTVTVFTNAGNGILVKSQTISVPGLGSAPLMAVDVDGDGYTDLLVDGRISNLPALMTLFNSGSGGIFITNFLNNTNVVNMATPNFSWTAAADINGDGKPDFVGYNQAGPPGFFIYTNGIGVTVTVPPLGVGTAPGHQVALYWPGMNATNYAVQMTTNLNSGIWITITNSTPLTGISISNALPAAFFRLQPQ